MILQVKLPSYTVAITIDTLCYYCQPYSIDTLPPIGGRKGGAMGVQPHLILRVLHRILFFTIEMFSCLSISPTCMV